MKYQTDAHHYRRVVRRRRVAQRVKGISLIAISLALIFYSVPCFAVSVFDYGLPQNASSTAFSGTINDHETTQNGATATGVQASEKQISESATLEKTKETLTSPAYSVSDYSLISNTTGPGALTNEAAVSAARTRSEALAAAAKTDSGSQNLVQGALGYKVAKTTVGNHVKTTDLALAVVALVAGIVCAILGVRIIVRSRHMLGMQIAAAYGYALRA